MCGRYTLHASPREIARRFDVEPGSLLDGAPPRYNIAPTQEVPAVGPSSDGGRGLALFRWGLVPHWADDPSELPPLINARSETVHRKPAFREAFARRRCLLPADGFYEWRREGEVKQPYHLRMPGGDLFAFAGIWDRWSPKGDGGETIESCAILTTDAAPGIADLHERMPVILRREDYGRWLDRSARERGQLQDLLESPSETPLEYYPVSRRVNRPAHDDPSCIEPLED
jgi:putative SOS response-associated peptidase YedK